MKRVLLTGASGWIGKHCIEPLLKGGFEVHGTYKHNPGNAAITWHPADLLDPADRASVIRKIRPSHLLHLAWDVTPGYRTSPQNVLWREASIALLDQFIASGGVRFVGAGTCLEYDWATGNYHEGAPAAEPSTPYGRAKLDVCSAVCASGISSAWGRIFFPFGPDEPEYRLVPSILLGIMRQHDSIPCSQGTQIRDFIYVRELGRAFAALLDSNVQGPVNMGSGEPKTIKQFVTDLARWGGGNIDSLKFGERPAVGDDAAPRVVAHVSRLFEEVGFVPAYDWSAARAETLDFWEKVHCRQAF